MGSLKDSISKAAKGPRISDEKLDEICRYVEGDYLSREQAALVAGVRPEELEEVCSADSGVEFEIEQAEARAVQSITKTLKAGELSTSEERALGRLLEAVDPGRFSKGSSGEDGKIEIILDEVPMPPEQIAEEIEREESGEWS
jgi:hypothetical protein